MWKKLRIENGELRMKIITQKFTESCELCALALDVRWPRLQAHDVLLRQPQFGGVLDVIDSPLLAAPFAYLAFSLL